MLVGTGELLGSTVEVKDSSTVVGGKEGVLLGGFVVFAGRLVLIVFADTASTIICISI